MKILVIYEIIPEETKFYLFDNVNENSELYKNMLLANGHYVNFGEENAGAEFLNEFLVGKKETEVGDIPFIRGIDVVIHTGFGL